ncbi:MAG: hypothetical protein WBG30_10720 [Psychrilyobacter sp.]|uniref:hypothetical protein n=1 Tax=Psychrilyobacter sp. TaxID=2586924 RepID=UPI003C75363D
MENGIIEIKKFGFKNFKENISLEELFKNVIVLEYESYCFKLKKNKGRPKEFYYFGIIEGEIGYRGEELKNKYFSLLKTEKEEIKKVLPFSFGKRFLEKKVYSKVLNYAKTKNIPLVCVTEI